MRNLESASDGERRAALAAAVVLFAVAAIGTAGRARVVVADEPVGPPCFLILKTGEPGAEPEKAGRFLEQWAAYLSPRLAGRLPAAPWVGLVTSDPSRALALAKAKRPRWGIVTAAFFLDHQEDLGLAPLRQTRRNGRPAERYTILARKGSGLTAAGLAGKRVATLLQAEADYVRRVGLESTQAPAADLLLVATRNLADSLYDMVEEEAGAPDAVLLDQAARDFFEKDELTWPRVEVVCASKDCAPDLVVSFGEAMDADGAQALTRALDGMREDEEGKRICRNLQTDGFGPIDEALLSRARELYKGGAGTKQEAPGGTPDAGK
ncbi:MAG: PhnD/SsuA/transferrin family substrate-binding protein [Planctomycetes bacterium]|nr:PhnD/SsuA/transferrin family substrate-binding protein [Planctomycetota bacterium]